MKLKEARSKTELLLLKQDIDKRLRKLDKKQDEIDASYLDLESEKIEVSKYVEFNSQSYASFYNTKLEKDKSILTLSVAGLGFLITFTNLAKGLGVVEYAVFCLSALAYLCCIFNVITIFEKNALYIIEVTTDSGNDGDLEIQLKRHDKIAIRSFYVGIILSFILGLITSIQSQLKDIDVTNKNQQKQSSTVILNDSYAGLSKINESFSGMSAMKPKPISAKSSSSSSSSYSSGNNSSSKGEKNNG